MMPKAGNTGKQRCIRHRLSNPRHYRKALQLATKQKPVRLKPDASHQFGHFVPGIQFSSDPSSGSYASPRETISSVKDKDEDLVATDLWSQSIQQRHGNDHSLSRNHAVEAGNRLEPTTQPLP
jgi:hypothetical protein